MNGRVPWWARLRGHRWSSIERAGVIAAVAIVLSALFVTTYSLALGDPVPRQVKTLYVTYRCRGRVYNVTRTEGKQISLDCD